MTSVGRFIHPNSNIAFGKISELAPGASVQIRVESINGGEPTVIDDPDCLRCQDPDGESHIFVFDPSGKQRLVAILTGGIVLPDHVALGGNGG